MVAVSVQSRRPHLWITLAGCITLKQLNEADPDAFEQALSRLPAGFTLVVDYARLERVQGEAVGVLLYYTRQIVEQKPSLIVVVGGQPLGSAVLSAYAGRLAPAERVVYVATVEEAVEAVQRGVPLAS